MYMPVTPSLGCEIDKWRKLAGEAALLKWGASHCVRDPVKAIGGKSEGATWCLVCPLHVDIQVSTAAFDMPAPPRETQAGRIMACLFS